MCLDCGEEQLVDTVPGQVLVNGEWKAEGAERRDQDGNLIVTGKVYKAKFLDPKCRRLNGGLDGEEVCGYFEDAGQQTQESPCPWPFYGLDGTKDPGTPYTCTNCDDRVDECDDCDWYCNNEKFWPDRIVVSVSSLSYESSTETGNCNEIQSDCMAAGGISYFCDKGGQDAGGRRDVTDLNWDHQGRSTYDGKVPCKADLESCPTGDPCSPFGRCDGRLNGSGDCVQDVNRPWVKLAQSKDHYIRNIEQVRSLPKVYVLTKENLDDQDPSEAVYYPNPGYPSETSKMRVANGWTISSMRGQAKYTCSTNCGPDPCDPTDLACGSQNMTEDCRTIVSCNTNVGDRKSASAYIRLKFSCDQPPVGRAHPDFRVKFTFWTGDDWDDAGVTCNSNCTFDCCRGGSPTSGDCCRVDNSSGATTNHPGGMFVGCESTGSGPDSGALDNHEIAESKYVLHLRTSNHFASNGFGCGTSAGEYDCLQFGFPESRCRMKNEGLDGTECYPTLMKELMSSQSLPGGTDCGYSDLYSYAAYNGFADAGFIYAFDGENWKSQDIVSLSPEKFGCAASPTMSGGNFQFTAV
tara:strand:+ start:63 stop:1793 length:1731 start_codon:yes stop_codon:yes gene_type:complete